MKSFRLITVLVACISVMVPVRLAKAAVMEQSVQLKAGAYFPATKAFDVGTGFDLAYSIKPFPYGDVEAGVGYYRAESGSTGFLSALPVTVSVHTVIPLAFVNIRAGGGIGGYYKMAGGTTELPADHSELSLGYHADAGVEFPTSNGLSLLLNGKYIFVNQGKFKSYDIKHDGAFLYGGFALSF